MILPPHRRLQLVNIEETPSRIIIIKECNAQNEQIDKNTINEIVMFIHKLHKYSSINNIINVKRHYVIARRGRSTEICEQQLNRVRFRRRKKP